MFVASILKLHLLRKGYSVSQEERIDGRIHDLVFSKKGVRSAPLVVIDLKKYNNSALKKIPKSYRAKTSGGAPIEHHTVFIKGSNEVMTDRELAEILGSNEDLKVSIY
ncbi:hypothetical protein ROV96_19035 [Stenotrophomonas pavanii]|nr:hypothetical protein [Stenotrophomonas pavanii]MDT3466033.1 hypothetical protein [Stenotrophomonas pavanii]